MAAKKGKQQRRERKEGKKAFQLFYDCPLFRETNGELNFSFDEIGILTVAYQRYDQWGIEPEPFEDRAMSIAWGELKGASDRNHESYKATCESRRRAANIRWHGEEPHEEPDDAAD